MDTFAIIYIRFLRLDVDIILHSMSDSIRIIDVCNQVGFWASDTVKKNFNHESNIQIFQRERLLRYKYPSQGILENRGRQPFFYSFEG